MNGDTSTIEIKKKRYNKSNLSMLLGLEDPSHLSDFVKNVKISPDILNISWILDDPSRLPVILEVVYNIPKDNNEEVRLALARAQIDAALKMNNNLQKYMKQKFVAETIEKLIFGELLLEGKAKKEVSRQEENEKNKQVQKKTTRAKPSQTRTKTRSNGKKS